MMKHLLKPHAWPLLLVLLALSRSVDAGADDDLAPLRTADAEHVRQLILSTAQLPGGEEARKLLDAPVLIWVERCFIGADNAYSGEGIRYVVARVSLANLTETDLLLKRDQISLQAGPRTFHIGSKPAGLRDMPLEIDWHADGHLRPQSQLATNRQIEIPRGKSVTFWCVFAGLDAVPPVPDMVLNFDFEGGRHSELNLNTQQRARLAMTLERIGPDQALAVLRIRGQLNRVNARTLADECGSIVEQGGQRVLIDWGPQAQPSDEVLFSWLLSATNRQGNENLLLAQLPQLPPLHTLVFSDLPKENRDVAEWEESAHHVFSRPEDAAVAGLREIFDQADPRTVLREVQSGHPWSQQAALIVAGDRLGPQAYPQILQLMQTDNAQLRRAAILALGNQPQPAAQTRLEQLIAGPDPVDAESALHSLLARDAGTDPDLLLKLLNDPQLTVPRTRILKLLADEYRPAWDAYIAGALQDPDPAVRRIALETLHRLGHADLTSLCVTALQDPDESVRETAFGVLVNRPDRASEQAAVHYALRRLRDGHVTEPILALIERLRETQAAPLLMARLNDPQTPHVRLIEVIGEIGSSQHLRELLQRLDQLAPDEQVAALELAPRLSIDTQLEIARKAAVSKESDVRDAALQILKSVGNDQALDILDQMLVNATDDDRETICITFGEIGTDAAIRRLRAYRERSVAAGKTDVLSAVDQALRIWRARLPGWNFVEAGYVHVQAEDEKEALKSFSLAILINPDLADAYSARGNVYLRLNQTEPAGRDFAQALRLDPFDGQAVTGVAIVQAVEGHWQESVKFVQEQAARFSQDRFFAYNTACVYGRAIEAIRRQPDASQQQPHIAELQSLAIKKLRESIEYGFNQFDWMQKDPDLAALRDLPDFKKLLSDE